MRIVIMAALLLGCIVVYFLNSSIGILDTSGNVRSAVTVAWAQEKPATTDDVSQEMQPDAISEPSSDDTNAEQPLPAPPTGAESLPTKTTKLPDYEADAYFRSGFDMPTYLSYVSVMMTAITAVLTAVAIGIAVLAVFTFREIKKSARTAATTTVDKMLKDKLSDEAIQARIDEIAFRQRPRRNLSELEEDFDPDDTGER